MESGVVLRNTIPSFEFGIDGSIVQTVCSDRRIDVERFNQAIIRNLTER
jgi:hypothetical protein